MLHAYIQLKNNILYALEQSNGVFRDQVLNMSPLLTNQTKYFLQPKKRDGEDRNNLLNNPDHITVFICV